MKKIISFLARSLLLVSAAIFSFSSSFAAVDKFEPYVYTGLRSDSNIFRTSSNEESDTIWNIGAGLKSDLKLSRQHLILDVDVNRLIYKNFDQLDNTTIDGLGAWEWQVGNLWSGNLGYKYNRQPRSYTQNLIPGNITRDLDMRTTQNVFFDAGYQIHPDWTLTGKVDFEDASYQERTRLDRQSKSGLLEVLYQNTRNTRVGLQGKYTAADLNNTDILGVSINNDYDIAELSGVLYWEGSAKSALELRLGYTDLNYDELTDRDFSGVSGRLIYDWLITGKTKLEIAAWREPSSLNNEIQDYVLSQGLSFKPVWSATTKVTVVGEVSYENNDFKARNDILNALGEQSRDDDIWLLSLRGRWEPRRYLKVWVGYKFKNRNSTLDTRDFTDHQFDADIRFTF